MDSFSNFQHFQSHYQVLHNRSSAPLTTGITITFMFLTFLLLLQGPSTCLFSLSLNISQSSAETARLLSFYSCVSFSLGFEWQNVSLHLQDSFQYSGDPKNLVSMASTSPLIFKSPVVFYLSRWVWDHQLKMVSTSFSGSIVLVLEQSLGTHLSFPFFKILHCSKLGWQSLLFGRFSLSLLAIFSSGRLDEIK